MSTKLRRTLKEFSDEKSWIIAILLILTGTALRLLFLEDLPYGLNQDEASAGYDAWALLHSGVDRNGDSWPVLFVSWGSGQNALMSYLSMPFIILMGLRPLSIRLPNALAGCVSLLVMWRLASRYRGERFGLCALFLLVINPWHIMASRWALESNLLPALLLGTCYFLSLSEENPKALIGAAICLGLAPYAYGTVFFLLPLVLIWTAIQLRKTLRFKPTSAALLVFLVLIIPIVLCQAINIWDGEKMHILGFTLPKLIDARQNATSIFSGGGLAMIRKNIMTFLEILHNGDDGVMYNAMPFWQGGIIYFFGLPLAVLGMIVSFLECRQSKAEWPMRMMLCCSVICTALIDGNINRLNMVWLPLIYFSALGGFWLIQRLTVQSVFPLVGALCCFLFFSFNYIQEFAPPGHGTYYPGLGEAIKSAESRSPEKIYITDFVRQPYIFSLFYTTPFPERFMNTAIYGTAPDGVMRTVERFEGFEFVRPEDADLLILTLDEAVEQEREILDIYAIFAICR